MPRARKPWFRFYTECFSDRKIRRLPPAQRWVWAAVLGAGRESPIPGRLLIAEGLPMTLVELADYAGVRLAEAVSCVDYAVQVGMLAWENGELVITQWNARQFETDDVTARTQKHRDKARQDSNTVPSDDVGTFQPSSDKRSGERSPSRAPATENREQTTNSDELVVARNSAQPRRRGTRLPDGWNPTAELIAKMRQECPGLNLEWQHGKFVDYWRSKTGAGATKLDWSATWRNWMKTAYERMPQAQPPSGRVDWDELARRAEARDAAREAAV